MHKFNDVWISFTSVTGFSVNANISPGLKTDHFLLQLSQDEVVRGEPSVNLLYDIKRCKRLFTL